MLLAELSHRLPVDPECAANSWDKLKLDRSDDRIPVYIAKIIANRCNSLSPNVRDELKAKISRQIRGNRIAVPHISAVCYTYACLCKGTLPNGGNGDKNGMKEIASFTKAYNKQVCTLLNDTVFVQIRCDIASRAATCTPGLLTQQSLPSTQTPYSEP
jgi:hypothetical protein